MQKPRKNFIKSLLDRRGSRERVDITERFELIGRVGQGSMSKVWRARDMKTGMIIALKVLDGVRTRRFESRFVGLEKPSEGEVAVQLKHPNIVTTYEFGETLKGEQFLVMEFVEGIGLSYLVDTQNAVMRKKRLRFMIQLGDSIAYFHKQGWIHRDICPRNVLVNEDSRIKLIDFGLVVPNTPEFQKPGNRTGTVNYMAPELIKRQKTNQQIDVFSYAVTCYEMFTQDFPWASGETLETVLQHVNQPPIDIRERAPDIDDEVAEIIMRGLERSPADRWPNMQAMVAKLRAAEKRIKYGDEAADLEGYVELDDELFEEPQTPVRPRRAAQAREETQPALKTDSDEINVLSDVGDAFAELEDLDPPEPNAAAPSNIVKAESEGEEIDKILDDVFSEPYEDERPKRPKVWTPEADDDDGDEYEEALEVAEDDDYEEVGEALDDEYEEADLVDDDDDEYEEV